MSMRDHYRTKAAEFHVRARIEPDEATRRQYENRAKEYSRLAERADRDAFADLSYEPAPPRLGKRHT
jgi:hypothetical protein